jgi:ribosomal protein S18 acetylase RimI-like enzyme
MASDESARVDYSVAIATVRDIPRIVQFVNSAYRGDSSRLGWTTEADLLDGQRVDEQGLYELIRAPASAVLVMRTADTLLGCCHVSKVSSGNAYVGMVSIEPSMQNVGLGRQLLIAAETYARTELAASQLRMTVISVRSELLSWYQRRGYHITSERVPFPSADPRFGIPKRSDLDFVVLEKTL